MNTAHHILLYGCGKPGSDKPVWYVQQTYLKISQCFQVQNYCFVKELRRNGSTRWRHGYERFGKSVHGRLAGKKKDFFWLRMIKLTSRVICILKCHFVCHQIIYAWARDAPKLELPEGVGFKVGKDSPIKYLVLQVHYAHIHKFRGKCHNYPRTRQVYVLINLFFSFLLDNCRRQHRRFRNNNSLHKTTVSTYWFQFSSIFFIFVG